MKRILLLLLILVSTPFFGQTFQTWRTEATDNIWQTNNNWWNFPNGSPIVFGQQEWDNNHQLSQQSTADVSTWRFLYKSGAGSTHTFSGNKIRFFDFSGNNPSITNNSSVNQIINNNIEGDGDVADPLEIYLNSGDLTLNGAIDNMGSWLDVYGNSSKSLSLTGAISGSGGLTVKQNSTVTLSSATNSYSGATNVDAGTLIVQKGGHSASITTGAIAFTFASTSQAAGVYDFLPGQLGGSTSRTLTSNLVGGKTISFNYTTGDVTICDVMAVTSASITSNNANSSSLAKSGDVITLSFTTSEAASVTPSVSINGNAATVTGSGSSWSATKTVVGGDTNGVVTFSISFQNAFGCSGTGNTVTDGSSVTIDTTSPSFGSVTIASNNAGSASIAEPGDTVTLTFTTSESVPTPSVTMNGVSATVSGSGASWSATTTVLTCSGSVVSFSISISDNAGNTANSTTTTNGSSVTIGAQVGTPSFTTGATLVCQDASDETYTATAANTTGITYSVLPIEAGTIGSSTGIMNWDAGFSGDATITASADGCGGPLTVDRVVTVQTRYSFFVDADNDGFGSTTTSMECSSSAAVAPTGFATNDEDCDDLDQDINPDATEVNFNGEDDDCDGSIFNGHDDVVSNVSPPSGALAAMTTPIACSVATNTTPYSGASVVHKFRVTRTSPPAVPVEFESPTRTFAISSLAIAAYAATYEVQATAIVNGEEQPYNGNTAIYTTPAAPVISTVSEISTNQCNQTLTAINSYIYASNGPAVVQLYDFEVIREVEGLPTHTQVYTTTVPYFRLTSLSMPATYGTVYKVRSRYGYNSFGSEIRSSYSTQCTVTTPSLPTVQVVGTQCGQTLASINAYVYSTAGLGSANLYEFKVTRIVAPGETAPAVIEETIPRIVPYFRLTMLENLFIGLGKEYSVSVRYRVNTPGVTPSIQFSDWSPVVCSVFTPEFPTTGVVDAQCNLIDFTPSMSQYIYSGIITGATQYRFRLELFDELSSTPDVPVYSQSVDSPNNYVTLNQFTGLSSSTTYVVTVSVELYGEFGLFGKDCAVTTPTFEARTTATMVNSGFEATAYPNPFANNFTLGVKTSSQSSIGVKVFDMVGRLVDQNSLTVSELKNASIGDQYPSGVYNVVITQDGVVKTLRVVKR